MLEFLTFCLAILSILFIPLVIFTFKFHARVVVLETRVSIFGNLEDSITKLSDKFDDLKDEIHAFQLKNKD